MRELLSNQPKTEITGFPFTDEDYEKAKELLHQKYEKTSEIAHAHGQQIANLPVIHSAANLKQIHQFYRLLNVNVNSLKTLRKLDTAEIMVQQTLEKLGTIKTNLIRIDPDWQGWNFERLLTELRKYIIGNPEKIEKVIGRDRFEKKDNHHRIKCFQVRNKEYRRSICVYCSAESHRSIECDKVKIIQERKDILKKKRFCYNCTGSNHPASTCWNRNCARCNQWHRNSISHLKEEKPSLYMLDDTKETIHPTVVAVANHQKFRVLLDTGAGGSFVSSTFINHINQKPVYWESKGMEIITTTVT